MLRLIFKRLAAQPAGERSAGPAHCPDLRPRPARRFVRRAERGRRSPPVNARDVRCLGGLDTPLAAADEISIFPMVGGG